MTTSMTTAEILAANIAARREAEEILELIGEKPVRFWRALAFQVKAKLPPEPEPEQPELMSEEQALRFERTRVPYGKYQDCDVDMVPTEYLCWLIDGNEFTNNLRRYLKTERFKRRQADE